MWFTLIIIAIYTSFILDFLIWPIKSEASTFSLIDQESDKKVFKIILIFIVFVINLMIYLMPLILSIYYLMVDMLVSISIFSIIGLVVSISGRILSLVGSRVLLNKASKTLITESIYSVSRNPITFGMHLTLFGLIICFGQWYLWGGVLFYLVNMHLKIKMEEKHLRIFFGQEYEEYENITPRYILW